MTNHTFKTVDDFYAVRDTLNKPEMHMFDSVFVSLMSHYHNRQQNIMKHYNADELINDLNAIKIKLTNDWKKQWRSKIARDEIEYSINAIDSFISEFINK